MDLPRIAGSPGGPDTVAIECNSGAERVIALVSNGWDEALDDRALADVIARSMA